MPFIQGSYDAPTIVSLIVQALEATDDFTMQDEEVTNGYCLKHTPSNVFVTLKTEAVYTGSYSNNQNSDYAVNPGIRVIFSNAWDGTAHEPSGTINYGFIPFYNLNSTDIAYVTSPNVFSTSLWVDKYGFIMTIQNNYSSGVGVFTACEFFPSTWVEYDDSEKPIAFYAKRTSDWWNGRYPITPYHSETQPTNSGFFYVRPFRFSCQTLAASDEGCYMERTAYKSEGNNKCYFEFPWYENDLIAARKPYAQTRRWFEVDIAGGFSIGDILNWIDPDEVTVHKYIVAVVTSGQKYYAIPYENATTYV